MTLAIRAGTLIDGSGREPLRNATLLVEDGRIAAVGADLAVPRDARLLDYSAQTVLPGLIDCHVHLVFSASAYPLGDLLAEDDRGSRYDANDLGRELRAGIFPVDVPHVVMMPGAPG